jgi:peptidyl-prolyl cis-trans isomerase D
MLQDLRRYSKAFLYIVVVAFVGTIVFTWGADLTSSKADKGIVGEVNGEDIKEQTYKRVIENFYQQMPQTGRDLSDEEVLQLRRTAWRELVAGVLYRQKIEDLGITLTDVELAENLKRWPPQIVQQYEGFQNEQGGFDYQKYLSSMMDPRYAPVWIQIESMHRNELTNQKLQELVWLGAHVTGEDVKQEFIDHNELMKFEYAVLFRDDFRDPEIVNDTSEVLEYYESHQNRYLKSAEAQVKYVEFRKTPTASDSVAAREQAERIYDEIKDGADFAQMAIDLSDDPSAQSGGDLGWFGVGAMVPAFEEAAFALADSGDVSEVIETEFGWHVIMKTGEREKDGQKEVRASHILSKFKPSGQTLTDLQVTAQAFIEIVEESSFEEAAQDMSLEIGHSGGFTEGGYAGTLGESTRANEFAFSAEVGEVSRIIEEPERFLVLQLESRTPAGIPSFEKSYGRADMDLTQKKLSDRSLAKAQEIHDLVVAGTSLESAASQAGAEYYVTPLISRRDKARKVGNDPSFLGTAFSLTEEEPLSKPIVTSRGAAVIRLLERQAPNLELFSAEQDSIHQSMLGNRRQELNQEWFSNLQEQSEVKNFLHDVFDMY